MILTCPECATRYTVADDSVPAEGRTVRCANCGASWRAHGAGPLDLKPAAPARGEAATPAFAPGTPGEALPRAYREREQARKDAAKAAVGGVVAAVLGVALIGALAAAIVMRESVVDAWPGSAGLFAAIGLPVNTVGLEFEAVTAQPVVRDGRPLVQVGGRIRNVSGRTRTPPPVRAAILDAGGRVLTETIGRSDRASIPAGETRAFQLMLADPPATAADVDVSFVSRDRPAAGLPTTPRPSAAPVALPSS